MRDGRDGPRKDMIMQAVLPLLTPGNVGPQQIKAGGLAGEGEDGLAVAGRAGRVVRDNLQLHGERLAGLRLKRQLPVEQGVLRRHILLQLRDGHERSAASLQLSHRLC